jgi:hypothetical protein
MELNGRVMKISLRFSISLFVLIVIFSLSNSFAQSNEFVNQEKSKNDSSAVEDKNLDQEKNDKSITSNLTFSGNWFLAFQKRRISDSDANLFTLKRGHLTIKKVFNENISARITQETSTDLEGDGAGDVEFIMKYAYIQYNFDDFIFLTKPNIEFGVVHRPWTFFEETINDFRVQGRMFLENRRILASADYGFTFAALLGGELDKEYKEKINSQFAGKYGSISFGIYNGGGYDAFKPNKRMFLESRLSLRPLSESFPGLQVTGFGGFGKGNVSLSPSLTIAGGFVSYECQRFILTAQYYAGKGNKDGTAIDSLGNSLEQSGYSFFSEFKIPDINVSLFGRFDKFTVTDFSELGDKEYIVGIAFYFLGRNKILIDYDLRNFNDPEINNDYWIELALEFRLD